MTRDRAPARHRPALQGQPDARQGGRERQARVRRRHQLHRVQLPDPAGAPTSSSCTAATAARCRPAAATSGATSPRAWTCSARSRGSARTPSRPRWSRRPTAPSSARPSPARSGSTPSSTSPYAFYQFWINADDADVPGYLRLFSMKDRERARRSSRPRPVSARPPDSAQRELAAELTTLVHGERAGTGGRGGQPRPVRPGRAGRASTRRRWRPRSRRRPTPPAGPGATRHRPSRRDRAHQRSRRGPPGRRGGRRLRQQRARAGRATRSRTRPRSCTADGWCCDAAKRAVAGVRRGVRLNGFDPRRTPYVVSARCSGQGGTDTRGGRSREQVPGHSRRPLRRPSRGVRGPGLTRVGEI